MVKIVFNHWIDKFWNIVRVMGPICIYENGYFIFNMIQRISDCCSFSITTVDKNIISKF